MLFCGRHSCTLCGPQRPPGPVQSPDRLLAGRRAREPANSWRTEEDGAEAEGRGRGQAGKKIKYKERKNSFQKKKKKQLHAVSVFECCFLCFLSGFRDLVIQFSSAGPLCLLSRPLCASLLLLSQSVSSQMASG